MRGISSLSRLTHSYGLRIFAVVAFVLAAGVYTTGVQLEANDSFCASCHVEPETTFYQASLAPVAAVTLAAFHAGKQTLCVDCHSRQWIPGRLWAQWGGLQNLLAYRSGHYRNLSETTRPVGDGGCTKCHSDLTWVSERPGHYHSPWLRWRWRAADAPANTCEACHPSHEAVAPAADHFMDAGRNETQCDACHDAIGTSPAAS